MTLARITGMTRLTMLNWRGNVHACDLFPTPHAALAALLGITP
ncbi:hypothetical protein [Streptomyces lavendulocolor]